MLVTQTHTNTHTDARSDSICHRPHTSHSEHVEQSVFANTHHCFGEMCTRAPWMCCVCNVNWFVWLTADLLVLFLPQFIFCSLTSLKPTNTHILSRYTPTHRKKSSHGNCIRWSRHYFRLIWPYCWRGSWLIRYNGGLNRFHWRSRYYPAMIFASVPDLSTAKAKISQFG